MKYKDLNLKKIRDKHGLDFAHFTYKPGMCSCCYGPRDLAKRYWKNGIIPDENADYTYLLFKNADNGGGHVKFTDEIKSCEWISWNFPQEKLVDVCKDLQEQFGDKYVVLVPKDNHFCIVVGRPDNSCVERYLSEGNYLDIREV